MFQTLVYGILINHPMLYAPQRFSLYISNFSPNFVFFTFGKILASAEEKSPNCIESIEKHKNFEYLKRTGSGVVGQIDAQVK